MWAMRTPLAHGRTSTAAGADRGSGSVRLHRIARRGWQRTRVQERSRAGRLAWIGTASAFERRPQRPTRDKQTRRSLSAHSALHRTRSALRVAERRRDQRSVWACRLKLRAGPNVAAVALANKNVRFMWAMLTRGEDYRRPAAA